MTRRKGQGPDSSLKREWIFGYSKIRPYGQSLNKLYVLGIIHRVCGMRAMATKANDGSTVFVTRR